MVNNDGHLPLVLAIYSKNKELVWYLSKKTRVESPSPPFFIPELTKVLRNLIQSGYPDVALYFVHRFPSLALAKDEYRNSLLIWLAYNPSYFFSGSNLGFLEGWIYKFVRVEIKIAPTNSLASQARSFTTQECSDTELGWFKRLLWKAITQLVPSIKIVRDAKMTHECAIELVNHVVNELSPMSYSQICHFLQNPISILGVAIEGGVQEIVRTLLRHFPDLTFLRIRPQRNILQAAIECRQEKIVNIIKEISPTTTVALCSDDIENINTLHLAGKLAPAFKLFSVSGTALQMQRELQWFKEVENITFPNLREWKNMKDETAKDVFRKEHKELAEQGERWMKDTADSCMLVSTLIATVLFAAAFTIPGGIINDKGIPIFLRTNAFTLFAISDTLGLFSSLTSLLMFLAILTSRYEIEDFLESLPKKLIIGLGSLFLAIAAMIIAFGAALTIILSERWNWVYVPVTILASIPVIIFVRLQLPLFVQMVRSTYGFSIFRLDCHDEKVMLKNMFSFNKQRVCLTTDCWTSIQNTNYMVITSHFIDSGWELHKRTLNFCVVPNHKGETIGKIIEACLIDWGIDRVLMITIDNASANDVAIKYVKRKLTEHLKYYRSLHNAAKRGDWESAKSFIEKDPNALTARITVESRTVLHVAALCDQWEFILKLLELVSSPESIAVQDKDGRTVLHYVALGGSLKTAKALVKKNVGLPQISDNKRDTPLLHSIWSESKELVWYLSFMTSVDLSPDMTPWILRTLILSGYHDIALYFIRRYPNLALAKLHNGTSLLYWLATNPSYFFSGSNLGLIERWIYKCEYPCLEQNFILKMSPSIKTVRDAKMTHECAIELVNHVVNELSKMSFNQTVNFLQNPRSILGVAVQGGIEEIVQTLLRHFPDLIFVWVGSQRNILQVAIECRQEKIVNIIKEISPSTTTALCSYFGENNNTTLHLAGKLAPAFKLFSVSGAALQMQRELQWFKEVEMYTHPAYRVWRNSEKQTAKDVFRIAHKKLSEDGEKWMKDTANSCMLVSTLIATVLFAAAFTVPGGNVNDNGIPIFLQTKAFTIFAISNALGLFSSLTSLLMFVAILTARYEMEDFLKSLPKKLIIGLGSLFFAIAAMIIAFGAALTIILNERWHWVSVPITLVASFPMAVFVVLQLPLFVQMVQSTYGASIFRPGHQEFE
ncbi:hypothetical protein Dsin_014193 [Dipteronia sinensis]|uniref:PGG domain-containing protein n=1 Tax=Dipteronia sinensis TaxID=43782 RepID=A0AAE0E9L2_9ROSI|nr:hypothetical protein Dsin_014193 [Dipteronia sinensis]